MNNMPAMSIMVPIQRNGISPPRPRYDYSANGGSGSNLDVELRLIYDSMVDLRE